MKNVVQNYSYTGLPSSFEYFAATELEMWKLCQEEAFTEKMRNKEATYLFQLQEEWKRREDERQSVFTQKVSVTVEMKSTRVQTLGTYHSTTYMYHNGKRGRIFWVEEYSTFQILSLRI